MRTLFLVAMLFFALGVSYMLRPAHHAQSSSPLKATSGFEVNGRAINAAGEAVAGADVFVESDGVKPRIATDVSDKEGYFSIRLRELGNYTVYGSKEEDGYPLTVSAFHKQVTLDQIPKLHIAEPKNVENVILQLGQSAAKIEGTVKDVLSDRAVRSASITLRRADNPDLLYRTSTDYANPGKFNIIVPTEPFTMTVESVGYHAWTYRDDGILARTPQSIKLNRGERRKLEVGLRKTENR